MTPRKVRNQPTLSSRPERTRISCCAAVDRAACAAFREESRMKLAEPTNFNRKCGGAQWRDLQFLFPTHKLPGAEPTHPLSSRPKRTRISCCAAVDRAACAAFRKESRMKLAEPTKFNRNSGGAKEGSTVSLFPRPSRGLPARPPKRGCRIV
jgi:hypothetical protein